VVILAETRVDNPSTSIISRGFVISSDFATDPCDSMTGIYFAFFGQFGASIDFLFLLIDLISAVRPAETR
jgi:hypothetical protein